MCWRWKINGWQRSWQAGQEESKREMEAHHWKKGIFAPTPWIASIPLFPKVKDPMKQVVPEGKDTARPYEHTAQVWAI